MKHSIFTVAIIASACALFSCVLTPKNIPEDLTAKELIQKGQTAFDKGNKKAASAYYTALLERYGDDPAYYIEAKYEIAHIYIKKKQYKTAAPLVEEVLEIYRTVPSGTLPGSFNKLAEVDYAKIPDKYKSTPTE
mgnify:CR=1 FL=1